MDLKDFHHLEVEEIKKHRWIESEHAGRDLSDAAEADWVQKHAAKFRKHIEEKYGPIKTK
jgi:hypothetical protein